MFACIHTKMHKTQNRPVTAMQKRNPFLLMQMEQMRLTRLDKKMTREMAMEHMHQV